VHATAPPPLLSTNHSTQVVLTVGDTLQLVLAGIGVSKDAWMLGIGIGLLADSYEESDP
jgi:hypothetical protein